MRRSISFASALVLAWWLGAALATRGEPDRFSAHYQRAVSLYAGQRYQDALRELEAAYAIQPFPRLLYNLGQVHRKLGHVQQALNCYELYLRTEPNLQAARRSEVEGYMVQLGAADGMRARLPALSAPVQPQRAADGRPLHQRWWFWGALGAGTAVTVAVVATVLAIVVQPAAPTNGP